MSAILVGAMSGLVLSGTASYLITGRLFHRYQARTPSTWRAESWRQHALAMLLQALAGAALGGLYVAAGSPAPGATLFQLAAAAWIAIASVILIQALYVKWHPAFVLGLLIDWAVFVAAVSLACARYASGR